MKAVITGLVFVLCALAFLAADANADALSGSGNNHLFTSTKAREHEVSFQAAYRTKETSVEAVQALDANAKQYLIDTEIHPTLQYVYGPLVEHALGGPQAIREVIVDWDNAKLVDGVVELPYTYYGLWLVEMKAAIDGSIELPLPYSKDLTFSKDWKKCTDSEPDHQTEDFYWYFWLPSRRGCDQVLGQHYQNIVVDIGAATINQDNTSPEYKRLIADGKVTMTVGFGYVTDPTKFNPETDNDFGIGQYRSFVRDVAQRYPNLKTTPILQGEYKGADTPNLKIGVRFEGQVDGLEVRLNVVTSAGIDQMELFAKSFAHDHDDVFGWFGHSRVGSGFDAQRFGMMLRSNPEYYSVTNEYQVIYWAGCNSYSYYSLPFFRFKAKASNGTDMNGTKNLDIISNGLPSYFSLNRPNALLAVETFFHPQRKTTYQQFIAKIEELAEQMGTYVLANVIGDEDNN